jgi:hypothetical protein
MLVFSSRLLVEPINLFVLRVLSSQMWNHCSSEVEHHVTLKYLYCTGQTERQTLCTALLQQTLIIFILCRADIIFITFRIFLFTAALRGNPLNLLFLEIHIYSISV